jgi:hypothetical protein
MQGAPYRSAPRSIGPVERIYAEARTARPVLVLVAVFGLPGLALVAGFQSGDGQVFAGDRNTSVVLGALLLVVAALAVASVLRKAMLSVAVHEGGFVWLERGLPRTVLWSQVVAVRGSHVSRRVAGVEAARTHVYTFVLEGGRELVATNLLEGVTELAARFERAVAETQPSSIRKRLDAGEAVSFGPLLLTPRGVELVPVAISWTNIKEIEVVEGYIRVRSKDGATLEVEWSKVDNAPIFLQIARERLQPLGEG